MLAKTAQKHDYPSAAWRRSYARRTGAERGFATAKDPATNDIARGWCRLMGPAPLMLFTTALLVTRNQRILAAWNARQEQTQRRAAPGSPEDPQTAPHHPRQPRRRATLTATPRPQPAPVTTSQDNRHSQAKARPAQKQITADQAPRYQNAGMPDPKRENRPH